MTRSFKTVLFPLSQSPSSVLVSAAERKLLLNSSPQIGTKAFKNLFGLPQYDFGGHVWTGFSLQSLFLLVILCYIYAVALNDSHPSPSLNCDEYISIVIFHFIAFSNNFLPSNYSPFFSDAPVCKFLVPTAIKTANYFWIRSVLSLYSASTNGLNLYFHVLSLPHVLIVYRKLFSHYQVLPVDCLGIKLPALYSNWKY